MNGKKISYFLVLLTLFLFETSILAQKETKESILKKHFKAIGQSKLVKASTYVVTGKIIQNSLELPIRIYQKQPDKRLSEVTVYGQKTVFGYNGKSGWMIDPQINPDKAIDIPEGTFKTIKREADFTGSLYDWEEKGHSLEYEGKEDLEGTEVYKLKLTEKGGETFYYFIDCENYLIIKTSSKINLYGTTTDLLTFFSEYKDIDGIKRPFKYRAEAMGRVLNQTNIDKIEFNREIDDLIFEKPEDK